MSGLGIRGDGRVSVSWEKGKLLASILHFQSMYHPWWSHRIEERKDLPGFFVDTPMTGSKAAEITVYSPNKLRLFLAEGLMGDLPKLCPNTAVVHEKSCENCGTLPFLEKMQVVTVDMQNFADSDKSCVLLWCDEALSDQDCMNQLKVLISI